MPHGPVHYSLVVETPADLAAYNAIFDTSDDCYVVSLGVPFTFNSASSATVDNVNVINGPGGVGRWIRGIAPGSVVDASVAATSNLGALNSAAVVSASAVTLTSKAWAVQLGAHAVAHTHLVSVPDVPGVFGVKVDAGSASEGVYGATCHFGYFANGNTSEPNVWWSVEARYKYGGTLMSEAHMQLGINNGISFRPISVNMNNATGRGVVSHQWNKTGHNASDWIQDAFWCVQEKQTSAISLYFSRLSYESDYIALGDAPAQSGAVRLSSSARVMTRDGSNDREILHGDSAGIWFGSPTHGNFYAVTPNQLVLNNGSGGMHFKVWASNGYILTDTGIFIGDSNGNCPSIMSGSAVPSAAPNAAGSLYLRTGGGVGSTLYVYVSGAWRAVAGV